MSRKLKGQYITNLTQSLKSGGWSGMNSNIFGQLCLYFQMEYSPHINPGVLKLEQVYSKLRKMIGGKRQFEFFSERRLRKIARQFEKQLRSDIDFLFFHGITPWIKCRPSVPYYAYVDATFLTYLDVYLTPSKFALSEINRIVEQEKVFLANASAIFFSSKWARQEAIKRYQLNGNNFKTARLGGNSDIPAIIDYNSKRDLLFVSMDFKRKGGQIAYEAFILLKEKYPDIKLNIIGDTPPQAIIDTYGVVYHGFIDKRTIEGQKRFDEIFKSSTILVHPTEKDMTPLIIVEAGYFGIPAIAPAKFGIPEMIVDGKTGFLLKENSVTEVSSKIEFLLSYPDKLIKMRKAVHNHMVTNFIWLATGNKIANEIRTTIGTAQYSY